MRLIVVKYGLLMICEGDYDLLLLLLRRLMVGRESALRRDEDGKKTLRGQVEMKGKMEEEGSYIG